ncbi:hypothetical protein GCM10028791_23650 [Echinicola sediminis]
MNYKKLLTFLGLVLLVALFILKGLPYLVNVYLNKNADEIVSDLITRTNDFSGHRVKFGKIKLDYDYRGTYLELDSVAIFPEEKPDSSKVQIHLIAERVLLSGFLWSSLLLDNVITLDSADLKNVSISSVSPSLDSIKLKKKSSVRRKADKDYQMINVSHIKLEHFSVENKDISNDSTRLKIEDLNVQAKGFKLSDQDLINPKALFEVETVKGNIGRSAIHFNDYRNLIEANALHFDMEERSLTIEGVKLDNKLGKYQYINDFEKETDWVEVEQGKLELINMNYSAYFRENVIETEKLQAKDFVISVFRDKRKPDNTQKRPMMIHQIIGSIPKPLHVDLIKLENGLISYEERPDNGSEEAGKIYFDQVNGEIINVTNIPEMLKMHNELSLKANAKIMGQGDVDLEVTYYLQDSTGGFTMNGHIRNMPLASINPMLRPATQVAIRDGVIDDLFFNIKGDDVEGTGELVMKYHDLAIDIKGKSSTKGQNIFQKIGSFLTNKFIIRTDNPNKKGELQKGDVYFKRDQSKFIFNYWWKLLLSGMRSTITGEDEAKMRKKANEKN